MSLGLSFSISWLGFLLGHISGSSGTCLAAHIHAGFSWTRAGLGLSWTHPGDLSGSDWARHLAGRGWGLCSSPGGSDGSHRK